MGNIAIIYRSKSGYTKKYAVWLANAVNADLLEGKNIKEESLCGYDTIVYGGGLYAGGINGFASVKKIFKELKGKKLIVFTLGASPVRPETIQEVKNENLTKEEQESIMFFMLRGGFDWDKLTFVDKILMLLLKLKLQNKKNPSADERGMLLAYSHPVDFTNKRLLEPVIEAINDSA